MLQTIPILITEQWQKDISKSIWQVKKPSVKYIFWEMIPEKLSRMYKIVQIYVANVDKVKDHFIISRVYKNTHTNF